MAASRSIPLRAADVIAGLIAPTSAANNPLRLRALLGPYVDVYTISADGQATLGRAASCDICLVHESVSRKHASIAARAGHWFLVDESSSAGTFLNGVKLTPGEPAPLGHGDLLRVGPWTFRVEVTPSDAEAPGSSVRTLDDTADTRHRIERVSTTVHGLAAQRFTILIECLSELHSAVDERAMATVALTHALRGTGYPRGAVLTPGTIPGEVAISAASGEHDATPTFSRALLAEAAKGAAVTLGEREPIASAAQSHSMAEMHVERAVCAPVMLGDTLCAYLYLDARLADLSGATPTPTGAMRDAGPFCEAIARALGLAMSNFRRTQLERRHVELVGELQAARAVQQTISPSPSGRVGHLTYSAHVEPGVYVAGDLFDVFPVGADGSVAVCLGDVAGHGVGSGMLMASTQAHLNAHLSASGNLLAAVKSLNRYLCDHAEAGRFVSLWVGLIAPDGTVAYIDAGHGHWLIHRASPATPNETHDAIAGVPVGVMPDSEYQLATAKLNPGDRLILYSDGVVEQRDTAAQEFGVSRLRAALAGASDPASDVRLVMAALTALAPQGRFDDDATIASLRFDG